MSDLEDTQHDVGVVPRHLLVGPGATKEILELLWQVQDHLLGAKQKLDDGDDATPDVNAAFDEVTRAVGYTVTHGPGYTVPQSRLVPPYSGHSLPQDGVGTTRGPGYKHPPGHCDPTQ